MRVVSGTGVGVTVLLTGLLMFYTAFALGPAVAQDDTVSSDQGNGNNEGQTCPEAEEVASIGPETESQQEEVSIEGDSFRISYDATINDDFGSISFEVEEDGGLLDSETVFDSETGEFVVLEGPGTFDIVVEVDSSDAEYTVTVEDCVGTTDDNNEDTDEDTNEDTDDVIDDTIPDKDLPDTGGSTALIVGVSAALLLYGGLVAWRLKTREQ